MKERLSIEIEVDKKIKDLLENKVIKIILVNCVGETIICDAEGIPETECEEEDIPYRKINNFRKIKPEFKVKYRDIGYIG